MKKILLVFMLVLLIGQAAPSASHAQGAAPLDVFLGYDSEAQSVTVYFANAVTGLSAITTIDNFPPELNLLEEFTLTANGVIYREPAGIVPRLITPNGSIFDLSFIPQRIDQTLLRIEWVVSPNGRTMAWAEMYFENGWQASLYVAHLDGTELRALPTIPLTDARSYSRVAMVAVSNDGSRVFFDLEHPTEPRRPEDLFLDYQLIEAYIEQRQSYFHLPGEPNCFCPASIADDGRTLIRLERTASGVGYELRLVNLEINRERRIEAAPDVLFTQAGDILLSPGGSMLLYAMGGVQAALPDDPPTFALVMADFATGEQRVVSSSSEQRLRPMAFIDRNTAAIVVDLSSQTTYKMALDTGELEQVANLIWLGSLQG